LLVLWSGPPPSSLCTFRMPNRGRRLRSVATGCHRGMPTLHASAVTTAPAFRSRPPLSRTRSQAQLVGSAAWLSVAPRPSSCDHTRVPITRFRASTFVQGRWLAIAGQHVEHVHGGPAGRFWEAIRTCPAKDWRHPLNLRESYSRAATASPQGLARRAPTRVEVPHVDRPACPQASLAAAGLAHCEHDDGMLLSA
jgi:hypothetical protein